MNSEEENDTPFNTSTKVVRTPPKSKLNYREITHATWSQTRTNTPTNSKQAAESIQTVSGQLNLIGNQQTELKSTNVPVKQTTILTPTRVAPKPHKMQAREIQKDIKTFVPEFSGEDTVNRAKELTRFLGTTDSLYNTLIPHGVAFQFEYTNLNFVLMFFF